MSTTKHKQPSRLTINVHASPDGCIESGIPPVGVSRQVKEPSLGKTMCVVGGIGAIAGLSFGVPLGVSLNSDREQISQAQNAVKAAQASQKRLQWEINNFCSENAKKGVEK